LVLYTVLHLEFFGEPAILFVILQCYSDIIIAYHSYLVALMHASMQAKFIFRMLHVYISVILYWLGGS